MKTLATVILVAVSLTACGVAPVAKVKGKQGSAEALYALSKPTKDAATRSPSAVDLTDLAYTCPQGGSAKLSNFTGHVDTSNGVSVVQAFTMTLTGCGLAKAEAGAATYSGTVQVSQKVNTGSAGVQVEQTFKGKVTIDGAFSDFLDSDISQTVSVGASQGQSAVSQTLKGTLTTASGTYSFDETVSVQGDSISADTGSVDVSASK